MSLRFSGIVGCGHGAVLGQIFPETLLELMRAMVAERTLQFSRGWDPYLGRLCCPNF